ncbi:MAG: hypothetical protein ACUVSW_00760 [Roseiflexus sp.]
MRSKILRALAAALLVGTIAAAAMAPLAPPPIRGSSTTIVK